MWKLRKVSKKLVNRHEFLEIFRRFKGKLHLWNENLQSPYKIVRNFRNFHYENCSNIRKFPLARQYYTGCCEYFKNKNKWKNTSFISTVLHCYRSLFKNKAKYLVSLIIQFKLIKFYSMSTYIIMNIALSAKFMNIKGTSWFRHLDFYTSYFDSMGPKYYNYQY